VPGSDSRRRWKSATDTGRVDAASGRSAQRGDPVEMVRVLDEDPALANHLPEDERAHATAEALAPLLTTGHDHWGYLIDEQATHAHLGLLVLDGLLARHLTLGEIGATEFLGPRDLLRPWGRTHATSDAIKVSFEILSPVRLAVLDREFATRISRWPELVAALLERDADRADSQLVQSALRQAVRVEDRVLLALWHFADRWGQETTGGRTITLPKLTGEMIANIVGARRQSISAALGQLADRHAIVRGPGGSWTLPHQPPQLQPIQRGQRASDQPQAPHKNA
jgi:CRP/FNR family transcriptional regulator, cyclic AMP receptor protein